MLELSDRVADFTGDPGGETVSEPRKAEVDLAARDRRPPSGLRVAVLAPAPSVRRGGTRLMRRSQARRWRAQQQQLGAAQADGVGLGPHQIVAGLEVLARPVPVATVSANRSRPTVPGLPGAALSTCSGVRPAAAARRCGQRPQHLSMTGLSQVIAGDAPARPGTTASRSARSRFSSRRSSRLARSSSRAIARSSPASSPCGTRARKLDEPVQGEQTGRSGRPRRRPSCVAGPRRLATRSGLTGSTV